MKGKEQSFWTGFAVVMLALFGGSGFFFYKSFTAHNTSSTEFKTLSAKLKRLEGSDIYPNQDHLEKMTVVVDEFEGEVDKLHAQLKTFQKPLNPVAPRQFPQDLKKAVEDFRQYRLEEKVVIPEAFYLGFNKYEFNEPVPAATGLLDFQLDAIDYLLRVAIDNDADIIYALDREETAVERGESDPEATQLVVRYPVTFSFRSTHDGFRAFLNEVSNSKEYFFLVRVLRIDNEAKDGPPKQVQEQDVYINSDGDPVTTEDLADNSSVDYSKLRLQDARIVMGGERLKVTAVIDICRFPEVGAASADLAAE